MKSEKGVTLVALIVIILTMMVIATISIYNGIESINGIQLEDFYMQMDLVYQRVDEIMTTDETYVDENGNVINIKQAGKKLTDEQKEHLQTILESKSIDYENIIDNFTYFTIEDVQKIIGLPQVAYNLFINFENKIVIAKDGLILEDKTYYTIENPKFFVETDNSKNTGTIESLIYGEPTKYNNDTYKVTVLPGNTIGDLNTNGYIKYKKSTSKYWDITRENELILEFETEYNIIYMDLNKNSIEKTIKIEYEKDESGNNVLDTNGNKTIIVTEVTTEGSGE